MSVPSSSAVPAVGPVRRRSVWFSVLLPHPDSPTIPRVSLLYRSKLTSSTAWTKPCFSKIHYQKAHYFHLLCSFSSVPARAYPAGTASVLYDYLSMQAGRTLLSILSLPDVHIPRPFRSVTMKSCTFVTIPFADRLPRSPSLLAVNSEISTQ